MSGGMWLDLALALLLIAYAVTGFRQGLVVSVLLEATGTPYERYFAGAQFLQAMGVTVFDPWFKPAVRGLHQYGLEDVNTIDPGPALRASSRTSRPSNSPRCAMD